MVNRRGKISFRGEFLPNRDDGEEGRGGLE